MSLPAGSVITWKQRLRNSLKKRGGRHCRSFVNTTHHRILKSELRACREKELRLVMPCSRACAHRTGGDLTSTFILKVSPRGLCNPNQVQPNHENPIFFHEPFFLDLAFSNSLTCIFTDSHDICGWLSYFKQLKICFSLKEWSKYCYKTTFFQPVSLTSVCTDALKPSLNPAAVQRAERTGGSMQVNLSLHQQSLHCDPTRKKYTSKSQKKEKKKIQFQQRLWN